MLSIGQMLDGIYNNAAAMTGLEAWNNAIAKNLAQSSTPGYKKETVSFEGEGAGSIGFEGSLDRILHRDMIATKGTSVVDFSAGSIQKTDIHTDFALSGEGFFELRTPEGDYVYTRDGQFKVSAEGYLVSKQGFNVMDAGRNPIQLLPEGGEISANANGSLSQSGQPIGTIAVREVDAPEQMARTRGGFALDPEGAQEAYLVEQNEVSMRQGSLEGSNVSSTTEMVNMIRVSRAFQLNQKIISGKDELLGRAIQTLGGR